jgi:hypothetical protein
VQLYRYFVSQASELAATILCVASQRVFIVVVVVVVVVVVYFFVDSVQNILVTPSCYSFTSYLEAVLPFVI